MTAQATRRSKSLSTVACSAHGVQAFYNGVPGSEQYFITNDGSRNVLQLPVPVPSSFRCLGCDYGSNQHRKMKQHWQRVCVKANVVIRFPVVIPFSVCPEEFLDIRIANGHFKRLHGGSSLNVTTSHNHESMESSIGTHEDDAALVVRSELEHFIENQEWEGAEGRTALKSVAPSKWLDDKVVNYCIAKVCLEESERQGRKLGFASSQAVAALRAMRENPDVIREVIKPWHLELDVLSLPIVHYLPDSNKSVHWSLLVADEKTKTFLHFDSITTAEHDTHAELVAQSLGSFAEEHLGSSRLLNYTFTAPKCSQQSDGENCGIYATLHNKCFLTGQSMTGIQTSDCRKWRDCFRDIRAKDFPNSVSVAMRLVPQPPTPLVPVPRPAVSSLPHSSAAIPQPTALPTVTPSTQVADFDFLGFAKSLNSGRVLHHIPRGARPIAADALSQLLTQATDNSSTESWVRLFRFPSDCLSKPPTSEKVSNLTSYIKNRITRYMSGGSNPAPTERERSHAPIKRRDKSGDVQLAASVAVKLADADVRGALRLLSSSDSLAPNDAPTYGALQSKHPKCDANLQVHNPVDPSTLAVSKKSLKLAIKSFPSGSSGGWDGLRPQHIQDLIRSCLGPAGESLLSSLARFTSKILQGSVPPGIAEVFFGARLIALTKKSGGIRPIAVGLTLRRIAGKICNEAIMGKAVSMFSPHQVGYGVKRGAEGGVHGLRQYLLRNQSSGLALLKIDFTNAFNAVSRDRILQQVKSSFPEALPFIYAAYSKPSALFWQNRVIWSEEGVQQGDPLGPFLFCLAVHALIQRLRSNVSVWYLDDGCLVGDLDTVAADLREIVNSGSDVGLKVNSAKCECTILSSDPDVIAAGHQTLNEVAEGIQYVELSNLTLLGAALHPDGAEGLLASKVQELQTMCERLLHLDRHDALFLLRQSIGMPRLVYTLRTSPCFGRANLDQYDTVLHSSLEQILNCALSDIQWRQAVLPVYAGGLGIRRASDVCLPAFISSASGCQPLANLICPQVDADPLLQQALLEWDTICPIRPQEKLSSQREWDRTLSTSRLNHILDQPDLTVFNRAILLAAREKGSGDWLNALPLPQLGLKLSDAEVRIAAGLRVGSDVIHQHACVCGAEADAKGVHGLSCAKVAGRAIRHTTVNQLIQRSLNSADFRATLEPPGLSRTDGKQPDGITLVPWRRGKSLMWDFSCKSTVAQSNISKTSKVVASAAEEGARLKHRKYIDVAQGYEFVPIVVETHGSMCKEARSFFAQLGRHLERKSDEPLSTAYLRQRVSVAVQKGNARCVLGTLGDQHQKESLIEDLEQFLHVEEDM